MPYHDLGSKCPHGLPWHINFQDGGYICEAGLCLFTPDGAILLFDQDLVDGLEAGGNSDLVTRQQLYELHERELVQRIQSRGHVLRRPIEHREKVTSRKRDRHRESSDGSRWRVDVFSNSGNTVTAPSRGTQSLNHQTSKRGVAPKNRFDPKSLKKEQGSTGHVSRRENARSTPHASYISRQEAATSKYKPPQCKVSSSKIRVPQKSSSEPPKLSVTKKSISSLKSGIKALNPFRLKSPVLENSSKSLSTPASNLKSHEKEIASWESRKKMTISTAPDSRTVKTKGALLGDMTRTIYEGLQ